MGKKPKVTLRMRNPEAADMWVTELNGDRTPDNVSGYDTSFAYFQCMTNPAHVFYHSISTMTSFRDGHNIGCIYCSPNAKIAFPGETDLLTTCPEAQEMWDYEKNGDKLDPTVILPNSDISAYFTCKNGHTEYRTIRHFVKAPYCQECARIDNLLITAVPQTMNFVDFSKTKGVNFDTLFKSKRVKIHFKCPECGYEWEELSNNWRKRGYCQCCGFDGTPGSQERNADVISKYPVTSFRSAYPELAEMWDYTRNGDYTPDNTLSNSYRTMYFVCPNGHSFQRAPKRCYNNNGEPMGCPYCKIAERANNEIPEENDLFTQCPEAQDMWDYDSARNQALDPLQLTIYDRVKADFKCRNGHLFHRSIRTFAKDPTCPYCKKAEGANNETPQQIDLFTQCPEAQDMWDYDSALNQALDPLQLTIYDRVKAGFKCQNGHHFQRLIRNFAKKPTCPDCNYYKKRGITVTRPDMLEFWDFKHNVLQPDITSPKSSDTAYWKCQKCGYEWEQKIASRAAAVVGKCPSCDLHQDVETDVPVSFRYANPKAAKLWIDELNHGLTPDNTSAKSNQIIYMRCANNPEHVFSHQVVNIPKKEPYGCPECTALRLNIIRGQTDFFTVFPQAKEMWDFEKNIGYDTSLLSPESHKNVYWKCSKGHRFLRSIKKIQENTSCPVCKQEQKIRISRVPKIMKYWGKGNLEKGLDPDKLSPYSKAKADWHCPSCGYEWQAEISSRYASKGLCPCCDVKMVVHPGINDLLTRVPELALDYQPSLNPDIDISKIGITSSQEINWLCHQCGYKWITQALSRVGYSDGRKPYARSCPVCSGIIRIEPYSTDYPELKLKFLEDENGVQFDSLRPKDSLTYYKWRCDQCGNIFHQTLFIMARAAKVKTGPRGCPYCAGKIVSAENSFASKHPELMDEYDPSNAINPYAVREGSNLNARWICRNFPDNPKHHWTASFFLRSRGNRCPLCGVMSTGKPIIETYPELEQYYDTERNEKPFLSLTISYVHKVWWTCEKGHHFQMLVLNQIKHINGFTCPICNLTQLQSGVNDLQTLYPDIAKMFDCERNGTTPDQVLPKGGAYDSTWWICKDDPSHHFTRSLTNMVHETQECPICLRKKVVPGVNDVLHIAPWLNELWDEDANETQPNNISDRSDILAWFRCDLGHTYQAHIQVQLKHGQGCMVCDDTVLVKGVNSIADRYPHLMSSWSVYNETPPEEILCSTKQSFLWTCQNCGEDFSMAACNRTTDEEDCPYCNNKKVCIGKNDLAHVRPELLAEYSALNKIPANQLLAERITPVYWTCPNCHGDYLYPPYKRELGDDSCPYCRGTAVLTGWNDLASQKPELVSEYSPENKFPADKILVSQVTPVRWICPTCHGEYSASPSEREKGDDSCPYCRGIRVLPGYNSFAAKHPDLMSEWSYPDNALIDIDPDTILDTNQKPVWWICDKHSKPRTYSMSPANRVLMQLRNRTACPYCKGYRVSHRLFG